LAIFLAYTIDHLINEFGISTPKKSQLEKLKTEMFSLIDDKYIPKFNHNNPNTWYKLEYQQPVTL